MPTHLAAGADGGRVVEVVAVVLDEADDGDAAPVSARRTCSRAARLSATKPGFSTRSSGG